MRGRRGAGLTLLESLLAASILAAAVVGISSTLLASHQNTQAGQELRTAVSLGRELMEEIAARPFRDPVEWNTSLGHDPDELTRDQYDNIGDYHGYEDSTDALRAQGGGAVDWAGGVYRRRVDIAYVSSPLGGASGDFALVTVTVTSPSGNPFKLNRMVACYPRK